MVYLLHFDQPYKHAGHYIGVSDVRVGALGDEMPVDRLPDVPLLHAAAAAGIHFRIGRVWDGDAHRAQQLRIQSSARAQCLICRSAMREPRMVYLLHFDTAR